MSPSAIINIVRDDILTFHMADYSERKAGKTPKLLKGRMKAIEKRLQDASATLRSLRVQILVEGGIGSSSRTPLSEEAGDADIDKMLDEMRKMAEGMLMASSNVARMFPSITYAWLLHRQDANLCNVLKLLFTYDICYMSRSSVSSHGAT